MAVECLVSNPLGKQKFHRDYINLRSHIIIYVQERFFKFSYNASSSLIAIKDVEALYQINLVCKWFYLGIFSIFLTLTKIPFLTK